MRTTMHRACSVAQPDAHPIGHGSRDGWDPLRGSGDKQAPEGTGWGVDRGSPVPARNSAPPGKSAPPREISPPGKFPPGARGGPPGGSQGGSKRGVFGGSSGPPVMAPSGRHIPALYISDCIVQGGFGGVFWGGLGAPGFCPKNGGAKKTRILSRLGELLNTQKKCTPGGSRGGPGGPPGPPGGASGQIPPSGVPPYPGGTPIRGVGSGGRSGFQSGGEGSMSTRSGHPD